MFEKTINIAYCIDNNYLMPMLVSAASVCSNLSSGYKLKIYVVHNVVDDVILENINKFTADFSNVEFILKKVGYLQNVLSIRRETLTKETQYFNNAIFYRLYLPQLIDEDEIIYLDSDTICNSCISALWNSEMNNHPIAAIIEPIPTSEETGFRFNLYNKIFNNQANYYFNSGVLKMNLRKINEDFLNFAVDLLNKYSLPFPDQDILNAYFMNNFQKLEPKFNSLWAKGQPHSMAYPIYMEVTGLECPYTEDQINLSMNSPTIIHFFSKDKPWFLPGVYYFNKDLFWHNYNKTHFKTDTSIKIEMQLQEHRKKWIQKAVTESSGKSYKFR